MSAGEYWRGRYDGYLQKEKSKNSGTGAVIRRFILVYLVSGSRLLLKVSSFITGDSAVSKLISYVLVLYRAQLRNLL